MMHFGSHLFQPPRLAIDALLERRFMRNRGGEAEDQFPPETDYRSGPSLDQPDFRPPGEGAPEGANPTTIGA